MPRSTNSWWLQNSDNKILLFCFHILAEIIFIRRYSLSNIGYSVVQFIEEKKDKCLILSFYLCGFQDNKLVPCYLHEVTNSIKNYSELRNLKILDHF